jgi:iron complex transport system ATP-binding protein
MNKKKPAIELNNVFFRYGPGEPRVLDNVSAEIPPNAITALLGPNGSGKSTLLHLLLGLLIPEEGSILVLGRVHQDYSRREMSKIIGLVPQEEHVVFDLNVLEYVLLGRAPYLDLLEIPKKEDRQLAREALETAGIGALEKRPVPSLSGGERQLVTVARALAQQPAILLLDEPTSHLDLANARRILGVLRLLKQTDKTIILTTHDPNAAAALADKIILLRAGKILAAAPPSIALTSEHLSSIYGVQVEVSEIQGRPYVLTHD